MPNLGIHAAMGETVRTVGRWSIVRVQNYRGKPLYNIADDEGGYCGEIRFEGLDLKPILEMDEFCGLTGPELVGFGQFVNDLNEYYADDGNRDAKGGA